MLDIEILPLGDWEKINADSPYESENNLRTLTTATLKSSCPDGQLQSPYKLFIDGRELKDLTPYTYGNKKMAKNKVLNTISLYEKENPEESTNVPFFIRGTYFTFIYNSFDPADPKGTALKILRNSAKIENYVSPSASRGWHVTKVRNIIKIQKILHKEGLMFDCSDDFIDIRIKHKDSGEIIEQNIGYTTETSFTWESRNGLDSWERIKETISRRIDEIYDIFYRTGIRKVYRNRLGRAHDIRLASTDSYWAFKKELLHPFNYVMSADGKLMFIDIDPLYTTIPIKKTMKLDNKFKDEIRSITPFKFRPSTSRKNRYKQYQSVEEEGLSGLRDMNYRYSFMALPDDMNGKTVLDIGCNLGRVCVKAAELGASRVVGIDYEPDTCAVASKYTSTISDNIEIVQFDVSEGLEQLQNAVGNEQFDYVFALAVLDYVDHDAFWDIIKYYTKDTLWFEHHPRFSREAGLKELKENTQGKFSKYETLGLINDCGARPNFKAIV